jgi:hypothetical protein
LRCVWSAGWAGLGGAVVKVPLSLASPTAVWISTLVLLFRPVPSEVAAPPQTFTAILLGCLNGELCAASARAAPGMAATESAAQRQTFDIRQSWFRSAKGEPVASIEV